MIDEFAIWEKFDSGSDPEDSLRRALEELQLQMGKGAWLGEGKLPAKGVFSERHLQ